MRNNSLKVFHSRDHASPMNVSCGIRLIGNIRMPTPSGEDTLLREGFSRSPRCKTLLLKACYVESSSFDVNAVERSYFRRVDMHVPRAMEAK